MVVHWAESVPDALDEQNAQQDFARADVKCREMIVLTSREVDLIDKVSVHVLATLLLLVLHDEPLFEHDCKGPVVEANRQCWFRRQVDHQPISL